MTRKGLGILFFKIAGLCLWLQAFILLAKLAVNFLLMITEHGPPGVGLRDPNNGLIAGGIRLVVGLILFFGIRGLVNYWQNEKL